MKKYLLMALLILIAPSGHAAEPIQFSDLEYLGAFRVPAQGFGGPSNLSFGGHTLAFNPNGGPNGSLMIGCFPGGVAEISIPALSMSMTVTDLNIAQMLQACGDGGAGAPDLPSSNGVSHGTSLPYENGLLTVKYRYYDYPDPANRGIYVKPTTNLALSDATGPYAVSGVGIDFMNAWLATVPPEWQTMFGGPVASGNDSATIISRMSFGPDAFGWDPAQLTDINTPLAPRALLYFDATHPNLGRWDGDTPDFVNTFWNGTGGYRAAVIPDGRRSILYFGKQGMDPRGFCYGVPTSDYSLDRTHYNESQIYCYNPVGGGTGPHGYPFQLQIMAFDLNDLAAVAANTKNPWDVKPYAVWPLIGPLGMDGASNNYHGGVAYDPTSKIIYYSLPMADNSQDPYAYLSLIHAWRVRPSGGPAAPTISAHPRSRTVNLGSPAIFNVIASGNPLPTYQWQKNGQSISGATSAFYKTSPVTVADNGTTFHCVVSNVHGSVTSQSATLTVLAGGGGDGGGGDGGGSGGNGGSGGAGSPQSKKGAFHPLNGETMEISLCTSADIFDRRGKLIRKLAATGGPLSWDGRADDGTMSPSGMYMSKCTGSGDSKKHQKFVLIK